MKFTINIKKLHLFVILFVIFVVGFVIAYGGNQPIVMGHSGGEVDATVTSPILNNGVQITQSLSLFLDDLYTKINSIQNNLNEINPNLNLINSKISACPSGMNRVGDFCIETTRRNPANWPTAVATCSANARHLCSGAEWVAACFSDRSSSWGGTWGGSNGEWAGDVITGVSANVDAAAVYGYGQNCDNTHVAYRIDNVNPPFRCCKNMI